MAVIVRAARMLAILALAGLLGVAAIWLSPGRDTDLRELDPRLTDRSRALLREQGGAGGGFLAFYWSFLRGAAAGDLGESRSLRRPVSELLRERLPVTLHSVAGGLIWGWCAGLALAILAAGSRSFTLPAAAFGLAQLALCLPAALIGFLFILAGWGAAAAIAAVVAPRVFRFAFDLIRSSQELPHVLAAQAKGLGPARILCWHVLPASAPALLALLGLYVTTAFGAAVPIEVLTDSPGIGQLAWNAALSRDLPVLAALTLVVAAVTVTSNQLADGAIGVLERRRV
jgi:peptide/nickel transport system permease protein